MTTCEHLEEELDALEPDLKAAAARGVLLCVVSQGRPPALQGQVVAYLGENVSAPTRFLLLVADTTHVRRLNKPETNLRKRERDDGGKSRPGHLTHSKHEVASW